MKGLQYIYPNRSFTLDELEEFMKTHWDTVNHNNFKVGKPTSLSAGQAIILPATARHVILTGPHSVKRIRLFFQLLKIKKVLRKALYPLL